jgi:hypothetical protein
MNGPNEEGDDELREAVSKNEARAELGGVVVVIGLFLEVVLTAAYRRGESIVEAWGPVCVDALIALGVAAEILFARKARSKAEALQRRSDEKVAEANARAAEANKKANEAALELAKFRAPRELTQEQRDRIASKLKEFSGTQYDIAVHSITPEILSLVDTVEIILSSAGWTELDWKGPSLLALTRGGARPLINISASVTNVMVGVFQNQPGNLLVCAHALSDALMVEGIAASAAELIVGPGSSTNASAIHILIGPKS